MNSARRYDVVIVGAGVAGCATAVAIKRHNPELSVCITDADAASVAPASGFVQRIGETLPAQIMLPLRRLGLWEEFLGQCFVKSGGTSALWGDDQPHVNEAIFSALGSGWHLDRKRFDRMFSDAIENYGIRKIENARCQSVARKHGYWHLQYKQQPPVSAVVVIDATGRRATVAQRLGIGRKRFDDLLAVYRFYATDCAARNPRRDTTTLVESAPFGWWYSAGLPDGMRVVAIMADADYVRQHRLREVESFNRCMYSSESVWPRLDGMCATSGPVVTSAQSGCLQQIAGDGWLAVGDAAFTFDPLSSLGVFQALRMSILASYAVNDHFKKIDRCFRKYQWFGEQDFQRYLEKRSQYYAHEQRYAHRPFWQRRIAA
ncbi:MAG: tryptophan 7-halogenase [Pseudomonadota bacterium]